MNRHEHWNHIYTSKAEQEVSWFEAAPILSLRLLRAAGLTQETCVIDIGGGDAHLVDALVTQGLHCLSVLDISGAALRRAQERLRDAASTVTWIEADVTGEWSSTPMDIWHDRALFHFLTAADDRARYLEHLRAVLKTGGSAIIATFALDGPEHCSGLPVVHYSPDTLAAVFGRDFQLMESVGRTHRTPWGSTQSFQYSRFTRVNGH